MVLTDLSKLEKIRWRYVAVDEAHRLKNKSSKLGNGLRSLKYDRLLLLTGTPIQNNTEELWTLLNFVNDKEFKYAIIVLSCLATDAFVGCDVHTDLLRNS
jgi:SNF2 family DNA or RNA helicase